nr:MAG: hypothetical protein [Molluscum contagiosum virus]
MLSSKVCQSLRDSASCRHRRISAGPTRSDPASCCSSISSESSASPASTRLSKRTARARAEPITPLTARPAPDVPPVVCRRAPAPASRRAAG